MRAPATRETPGYCCIRRDSASISFRSAAQADVGKRVSSVSGLAICARSDVPAFLQCLTDLVLRQMLLLRPILSHSFWLSVLRYELRRLHIVWFPIEIKDLSVGPEKIFGVSMALETPRHAMRFDYGHRRHVIDRAMTTETTDAAIHMRRVVIKDVIDGAMEPHPFDRFAGFPTLPDRFELRIVLLHLRVAVHAGLRVRH